MGAGSPFFKAHRFQHEWDKRHPRGRMYVSETGERDVPELVHIFDAFAREIGVERAYDYGCQRMSWLCNLFTNWMGDGGFLWRMRGELRRFNEVGDATWFEGKVVKKYREGDKCCVDIEAWAKNQRGEVSMAPSLSTAILPSRRYGPAVYAEVPKEIQDIEKNARPMSQVRAGR